MKIPQAPGFTAALRNRAHGDEAISKMQGVEPRNLNGLARERLVSSAEAAMSRLHIHA